MSLADNYKILSYTSDGEQTEFPILWRFFDKDTALAKVYRDGILEKELSYGQDYSVTPTGETGGKLVLTTPVAKGLVLAISRKEPYIQALELLNSGKIDLVKLEEALDHMVMLAQQNRDDLERGLQVPPGSEMTPEQFIFDLLKKYEEVMAESSLIKTALGNFFCSSIEPFVTQSGVTEYEVVSKIPLDSILNNLFLVLGGVAQEPITSFTIVDASHIRFTSDPGDGIRCWGITSLSMSSPDIRLVVEAAIQKIVAEGDTQAGRAKEFADAAAQSAAAAASDAQEVASDKQHVNTVAGQIQGLQIVVNTLNPGEQATASYDPVTGILTLGVPKGDSGDAAIASPTSLGGVMPQTGHEDGLELETDGKLRVRKASASQRGGVLASVTAAANAVPQAGEDGTLDASWVPRPDYWDMFPPFVPIPIWGATLGGSDGRRAIIPGEAAARENWILCDGGSDGKGGTVPDIRGRYIRGASEAEPEGTKGGSEDVAVNLSGSTGATTLSVAQMPSHTHWFSAVVSAKGYYMESGNLFNGGGANTSAAGDNGSHTHPLSGSVSGTHTDPHLAMNYFIKVV